MNTLNRKTVFITGASRGIGRQIALACASQGANVVIAAKSDTPHPKLPGTIHTVAEEVRAAGGQALPLVLDVRDEEQIKQRIDEAAEHFGGIDALINNAGAIRLAGVEKLKVSRFDLLHQVNARAVMACSRFALAQTVRARPYPEHVAATEYGSQMVCALRALHLHEIRHDHDQHRHG